MFPSLSFVLDYPAFIIMSPFHFLETKNLTEGAWKGRGKKLGREDKNSECFSPTKKSLKKLQGHSQGKKKEKRGLSTPLAFKTRTSNTMSN